MKCSFWVTSFDSLQWVIRDRKLNKYVVPRLSRHGLLLWPTLWVGHIVAPSTVSLLLYLHLFLAPFSCSFSLSPVRYPSRCSYYLCVHSLSLLYDIHPGVRTIFVFTVSPFSLLCSWSLFSLSVSLAYIGSLLSCFWIYTYTFIHSHWLLCFGEDLEPHSYVDEVFFSYPRNAY
jgi:hypothetical protein